MRRHLSVLILLAGLFAMGCSSTPVRGQSEVTCQSVLAGGTCCCPKNSNCSFALCTNGGDKCCVALGAAQCLGAGGKQKVTVAACAAANNQCN